MSEYYIKAVSPPSLKYMDGKEVSVEFKTENRRNVFSKCEGFLLYEIEDPDNRGGGSKCIFAKGYIKKPLEYEPLGLEYNKDFPFVVKCIIEKAIQNHRQGVTISEIKEICPAFSPHNRGGLYPIHKDMFDVLVKRLNIR